MGAFDSVLRELAALERVQADLAEVAARTDSRRRHDLIEFRRRLAAQIVTFGQVADPVFSALADREVEQTYRTKFSRMRSAAALHQAEWPAVRIGESAEAYRESAQRVRAANRDLVGWVRETIASLAGQG